MQLFEWSVSYIIIYFHFQKRIKVIIKLLFRNGEGRGATSLLSARHSSGLKGIKASKSHPPMSISPVLNGGLDINQ